MLLAKQALQNAGYIVKTFGLNFKVISPLGVSEFVTLSGLVEISTKIKQVIL